MKRLLRWSLVLALLPLAAFAQKSEEEAGDVSEADKDAAGPLRERVRPVSGHQFLMAGRFEASPGFNLSLRDAFFTKYSPTLALTYHFTEIVALGLRGGYSFSTVSGAAQICSSVPGGRECRPPTQEELTTNNAFGQMSLNAGLELQLSPIYGKIGLVAEKFLEFNMYLALGPTFLMYGPQNTPTVGGNIGVGGRFFINKFLCVRLELRDLLYNESFPATGEALAKSSFRNQLMAEVGLSIFLPLSFDPG
jgi:outer membrane beta-barrel protein